MKHTFDLAMIKLILVDGNWNNILSISGSSKCSKVFSEQFSAMDQLQGKMSENQVFYQSTMLVNVIKVGRYSPSKSIELNLLNAHTTVLHLC